MIVTFCNKSTVNKKPFYAVSITIRLKILTSQPFGLTSTLHNVVLFILKSPM